MKKSRRDLLKMGAMAGAGIPPAFDELFAHKDVVKSFPGTVTKLIMKFDLPTGTQVGSGQRYKYVWHCHILEHEDNEMMRPMDALAPKPSGWRRQPTLSASWTAA
jgi:FtsP/CotA-like multicopper oxidase with cupredoxin domain